MIICTDVDEFREKKNVSEAQYIYISSISLAKRP